MAAAAVQTSINFLTNDPSLYKTEKPYQIKYNAAPDIPVSNLRFEKQSSLTISSIRGREADFSFEKNGFTVLNLNGTVPPYEDFDRPEGVRSYILAATTALKALLGAQKVQAFQYVVSQQDTALQTEPGIILSTLKTDPKARQRLSKHEGQDGRNQPANVYCSHRCVTLVP